MYASRVISEFYFVAINFSSAFVETTSEASSKAVP